MPLAYHIHKKTPFETHLRTVSVVVSSPRSQQAGQLTEQRSNHLFLLQAGCADVVRSSRHCYEVVAMGREVLLH